MTRKVQIPGSQGRSATWAGRGPVDLFADGRRLLVGVLHLRPLPGSPRWAGSMEEVIRAAVADARAYAEGGVDALCIENFGDIPFSRGPVGPETVAAMAVVAAAVCEAVALPIGFNVLRNDARAALALCAACGGSFVRINVHVGAMLTDQGLIEGDAHGTLRYRRSVAPDTAIWADVLVKHAVPLGNWSLEIAAWDTWKRGLADALILSGPATSQPADPEELRRLRAACPGARILVGSGITPQNLGQYAEADGYLVGSSLKEDGQVERPVDPQRVRALVEAFRSLPPLRRR